MAAISAIPTASPRDITAIDLARVLSRLENKILSPNGAADQDRLLHSHYERVKTSANLEYARTLLLRLEHSLPTLKTASRKSAAQSSLSAQRALIKRLSDKLHDFERTGDDAVMNSTHRLNDDDQAQEGDTEQEDLLARYDEAPAAAAAAATPSHHQRSPSEPQNVIRNRALKEQALNPGDMTDTAAASGRETDPPQNLDTAQLLESADSTQAALTTSLLSLAQQLKASSQSFSNSLVADTEHLDRAVEGLDRNTSGMDAAGKRMGLLKRMSEGKGWWGRMMLYAWIGGLWVVAILLVGVAPKLRF